MVEGPNGLGWEAGRTMRLLLQGIDDRKESIYQWKDFGEARKLFGNWCAWVQAMWERTGELLEPMPVPPG